MIVFFIVIANEALKCFGFRYCDTNAAVELTRLWQMGLVEVMFEGTLGGVAVKVWRRIKDKTVDYDTFKERKDKNFE